MLKDAKEVISSKSGESYKILVATATVKSYGGDQALRTS